MIPRGWIRGTALVLLAGIAPLSAQGHPATERYIPIGQSPGLSESSNYIGRIRGVDKQANTLSVESPDGQRQTIQVTPRSAVWLDRSRRGRPPEDGTFADCRRGRRIEVKLYHGTREADWIKIESR